MRELHPRLAAAHPTHSGARFPAEATTAALTGLEAHLLVRTRTGSPSLICLQGFGITHARPLKATAASRGRPGLRPLVWEAKGPSRALRLLTAAATTLRSQRTRSTAETGAMAGRTRRLPRAGSWSRPQGPRGVSLGTTLALTCRGSEGSCSGGVGWRWRWVRMRPHGQVYAIFVCSFLGIDWIRVDVSIGWERFCGSEREWRRGLLNSDMAAGSTPAGLAA